MKVTEHVEQLLRQGHKPKELVELGFPKQVVTRVHRKLKDEKTLSQPRASKFKSAAKSTSLSSPPELGDKAPVLPRVESLESKLQQLGSRVEALEGLVKRVDDVEARLDGTPALGLKRRFKCSCGASGFVALSVECTKCGKQSYWGWWPEEA